VNQTEKYPWEGEPDELRFEASGLPCLILCHANMMHLCGYVGVPDNHPLCMVEYTTSTPVLQKQLEQRLQKPLGEHPAMSVLLAAVLGADFVEPTPHCVFEVHGGITFSRPQRDDDRAKWWFGFDCSHHEDRTALCPEGTYRTIEYVKAQCESLAAQLAAVSGDTEGESK